MRSYRACGVGAALAALGVLGCSRSSLDDAMLLGVVQGGSYGLADIAPAIVNVAPTVGAVPPPSALPTGGPPPVTGAAGARPTMTEPSASPVPGNEAPMAAAGAPTVVGADDPLIQLPDELTPPGEPDPMNPPCSAAAGDPPGVSPYWGIYGLQDTYAATDGESTLCVATRRGNGFCMWGTMAAHGDNDTNWGGLLGLQFARMTASGALIEPFDATAVNARGVHLLVDELSGIKLRPMITQADMPGEGTSYAEEPFVFDAGGADYQLSEPGDYYFELASARQPEWASGTVDPEASLDLSRIHSLQLQVVSEAEPTEFFACFTTVEFFDDTLAPVPALRPAPEAAGYAFDVPQVKLNPMSLGGPVPGLWTVGLTDVVTLGGAVYLSASTPDGTYLIRTDGTSVDPPILSPAGVPAKLWANGDYVYLGAADGVYAYNTLDGTFEVTNLTPELLPIRDIGGLLSGEGLGLATPTTPVFLPLVDGKVGMSAWAPTEATTRVFGGGDGPWAITEATGQLLRLDGDEWLAEPYGDGFKFGAASSASWVASTETAVVGALRGSTVESIPLIDPMVNATTLGPVTITDTYETFAVSLTGEYVFYRYPQGGWEVWPRQPVNPGAVVEEIAADDNYLYLLTASYLERIMIPRYDYAPAWAAQAHPRTSAF